VIILDSGLSFWATLYTVGWAEHDFPISYSAFKSV